MSAPAHRLVSGEAHSTYATSQQSPPKERHFPVTGLKHDPVDALLPSPLPNVL